MSGAASTYEAPLHFLQGNLNGIRYWDEILRPIAIPALQAMGVGSILQDDNATPHRVIIVTDFLRHQNVQRMHWPSKSPDMAPIEHLWDVLGHRVRDNHPPPANVAQLSQFLLHEWEMIPQVTLQTLVQSMRQRYLECLASNGGHTRY